MTNLLGKRVTVRVPLGRNEKGVRDGSMIEIAGTCTYIGPNEMLRRMLQITIGRMPIALSNMNQIIKVN
jgi:hypothetical protein